MLKLRERNVPYCQIKKTYDDVVSPIFEPSGRKDDVDILVKLLLKFNWDDLDFCPYRNITTMKENTMKRFM